MTDKLVPLDVQRAAARGFIRTFTQTLSSAIPIGAITLVTTQDALLSLALTAGGAVVSSLLAGVASYLSITSAGIPADYEAFTESNGRHEAPAA